MIIDKALQFSNKQAVTVTAVSTDVIDFGQPNPNTGLNDRMYCTIGVGAAATAAGAATVTITLQDSADNSTFTDVVSTQAIGKAALTVGAQFVLPMPVTHRRFVRLNYTVATGPLTTGTFSAQVVAGLQANAPQPDSPRIA